jgi:hypothetical protein
MAQGEVLEGELAVAADEEGQEPEQVEQHGRHRVEIFAISEPTDQTGGWAGRASAWRGNSMPGVSMRIDIDKLTEAD